MNEDIKERHADVKRLMVRNYPKELTAKIFEKDKSQVLEEEQFKLKIYFFEENIKHLSREDMLHILNLELPLEFMIILSWLQSKASPIARSVQNLRDEIYKLTKALLNDVPHGEKHEDDYKNVVERHLKTKAVLSSKIYQFLFLQEKTSILDTYDTAAKFIKEIMNMLETRNDSFQSWIKPSDHFWLGFAEDFLKEIEDYLNNVNTMSFENDLQDQILVLMLKRKFKLDISYTALSDVLHSHIKV